MRYAACSLVCLALLAGGCTSQDQAQPPAPRKPEDFGHLRGLKAVPDARLRDELARIVEQRGTPELLCKTGVAEADNAAVGLLDLFTEREVKSLLRQSEAVFPPARFELDPIRLQKAIELRKKYDAQRLRAREAWKRPQCDFGIQFMAGCMAEVKFIDVVWICARLEAFRAAEALAEDDADEAVECLRMMLRPAACLAAEKNAQVRLQAAFLRTKAFVVLQAIVLADCLRPEHLERLCELVQDQMQSWPSDADAWIGERAAGLHAYEMVREGYIIDLLTPAEVDRFAKEGILKEFAAAASRNVNDDELYYLQTMRKIIASCGQPYYQRLPLFESISADLQRKRNSAEYPIVAARVLLPKVREGQAIQAQDRANWEAWALALAMATGRKPPPYQLSPLSGEQYRSAEHDGFVEVSSFDSPGGDNRASIVVPTIAHSHKDKQSTVGRQ